jgi:hypothetical protein
LKATKILQITNFLQIQQTFGLWYRFIKGGNATARERVWILGLGFFNPQSAIPNPKLLGTLVGTRVSAFLMRKFDDRKNLQFQCGTGDFTGGSFGKSAK